VDSLPDEILLMIFEEIQEEFRYSVVPAVCRRFSEIVQVRQVDIQKFVGYCGIDVLPKYGFGAGNIFIAECACLVDNRKLLEDFSVISAQRMGGCLSSLLRLSIGKGAVNCLGYLVKMYGDIFIDRTVFNATSEVVSDTNVSDKRVKKILEMLAEDLRKKETIIKNMFDKRKALFEEIYGKPGMPGIYNIGLEASSSTVYRRSILRISLKHECVEDFINIIGIEKTRSIFGDMRANGLSFHIKYPCFEICKYLVDLGVGVPPIWKKCKDMNTIRYIIDHSGHMNGDDLHSFYTGVASEKYIHLHEQIHDLLGSVRITEWCCKTLPLAARYKKIGVMPENACVKSIPDVDYMRGLIEMGFLCGNSCLVVAKQHKDRRCYNYLMLLRYGLRTPTS
jgi:hypothetical protein